MTFSGRVDGGRTLESLSIPSMTLPKTTCLPSNLGSAYRSWRLASGNSEAFIDFFKSKSTASWLLGIPPKSATRKTSLIRVPLMWRRTANNSSLLARACVPLTPHLRLKPDCHFKQEKIQQTGECFAKTLFQRKARAPRGVYLFMKPHSKSRTNPGRSCLSLKFSDSKVPSPSWL